jgi:hypothetical protein
MNSQPELNGVAAEDISAMLRQLAEHKQFTMWRNPTDADIYLELHKETPTHGPSIADRLRQFEQSTGTRLDPKEYDMQRPGTRAWQEKTGKRLFVVKANGGTTLIPSEYDRAIQDVKDGVVMGGLGSNLDRLGCESRPVLHPALDALDAKRKEALADAKRAKEEIGLKEEDLLIARRRIAELENIISGPSVAPQPAHPQPTPKKDK